MISRRHRFHGYNSLRYVYTHGQTTRGPFFALKSILNPKRRDYRLAVVISRKITKSAFRRNRIRRRLYEIVRQMEADIKQPYDIVLTVFHDNIFDETPKNLTRQVKKQLREAGIIDRPSTQA